jgi:hypothetical protein
MGLDEERSVQKKTGYTRGIARSHNGRYRQHKERQDALRRTTNTVLTRVAKCTEFDGGIFENVLY